MVAMALALIIPGTIIFHQYTIGTQKAIVSSQIYKIGNDLMDSAELMYSVGENSWQTLEITFPQDITQMKVFNEKYLPSIIGKYDIEDEYRYMIESSEEDLSILGMCRLYIEEFIETLKLEIYTNDYDI